MSRELIEALQDPQCYDHPTGDFALHETHISWVVLTGEFAYKIKKPMDFGFLDFSTLAQRRHFCAEEVRLNRRLVADLYLDVVPITGSPTAPRLGGAGEPFEYAIRMHQFDPGQMLDKLSDEGRLSAAHMDELADQIAEFHDDLPATQRDELGTPAAVLHDAEENFEQIRPLLETDAQRERLDRLAAWSRETFERLEPHLARRHEEGHVRECHGDLHLSNVTLYRDRITVFDCIEFNERMRWIDTCNDLAFLLMDLDYREAPRFANRVLNRYLQLTGDFDCLPLLDFYKAYRAVVRAKIALLTRGSPDLSDTDKQALFASYESYLDLAEGYALPRPRYLLATTGVSGSGKSWLSERLAESLNLIWLRSDVERKRLFGLSPLADSQAGLDAGIYTPEASRETYRRLAELAADVLAAGYSVIVDSTALHQEERDRLVDVAASRGLPYLLLACTAPEPQRRQWLRTRAAQAADPSEADEQVMERQQADARPLAEAERAYCLRVETADLSDADPVVRRIRDRLLT
ncbi:AAA family ATPase [Halomonas ramblicola]|uniref:bifunctional aminoglycoside phosphotransferase/ATP-binding protein n=1 Tax=Halomonas ramblicola TaxID=747349 RepID=UPI0025B54440|nr:bifunctional aminoglycoside phosphotransferase/ATP-binding protein [Halomonas ramblicola]MDN3520785.1 AAA family ATPase [Halomonas ramblicola]